MLNDDTPSGAPIGVPTPEDTNAASRAGDAALGNEGSGQNHEREDSTSDALGEVPATDAAASHDPAIHWLVEAPPTPPAGPNWIDHVLGQVARKHAIQKGLIEATPFDRSGPVYLNLDHLPDDEVDPAILPSRELAVLPISRRDGAFMRAARNLSDADFEVFVTHLGDLDGEIPS